MSEYSRRFPGRDVVTAPQPGRPDIAERSRAPGAPTHVASDHTPVDGRLPQLDRTLEQINETMQQMQATMVSIGSPADSEQRLTKVEKAVKWFSPWKTLLGFVAFLAVGGFAVFTSVRDLAREDVIETVKEAHKADPETGEAPIEPSVETVEAIKSDLGDVKGGVDCLLAQQERQQLIKETEIALEPWRQEYAERIQEWNLKKAARRKPGDKPTKKEGHLALESKIKTLTSQKDEECK